MTDAPMSTDLLPADLLPADLAMGAVSLHVNDLVRTTAYYRDAVGLSELSDAGGVVVLGRGSTPVMVLRHTPGLPLPSRGQAGLFHTAILFEDATALAAAIASVLRTAPQSYVGAADHLVSRAFYATDPEGNGVELYTDRPRTDWSWTDGQLVMASLPLDVRAFVGEHLDQDATPAAASVGHVHLQVGDVNRAERFYVDTLGFERTAGWHDQALFVSAGGYHHHMAMNTWNSRGAGPRAATLGLGEVAIAVPARTEVEALADRLRVAGVAATDDGRTLAFDDPWRNRIRVSAPA